MGAVLTLEMVAGIVFAVGLARGLDRLIQRLPYQTGIVCDQTVRSQPEKPKT